MRREYRRTAKRPSEPMVRHVHQRSDRLWIRRGGSGAHDPCSHHHRKSPWHSLAHLSWTRCDSTPEPFVVTDQAPGARGVQTGVDAELPHAMVASDQVGGALSHPSNVTLTTLTGSTGSASSLYLLSGSVMIFRLTHSESTPLSGWSPSSVTRLLCGSALAGTLSSIFSTSLVRYSGPLLATGLALDSA